MTRRIASLCVCAWLAGCAVGPDYERPELDVPMSYRGQGESTDPASLGDLPWWGVFQDEALQGLIESALTQNRDIKVAAARVEEARAQVGINRLAQFPQVNASASGGRSRASRIGVTTLPPGTDTEVTVYSVAADVFFEVDLWGRLSRATEAARAGLLSTRFAQQTVVITLIGDVATAYFDLRSLDQQLEITQRTIRTREESLELSNRRHRRGAVSGLDVSRAEAELAAAQAALPELARQIVATENRLRVLLAQNPGPIPRAGRALDDQFPPQVPAGLPSALIERRPDLRSAEFNLVSANALIGATKAALFPTISLTGLLGGESRELSDLFSGPGRVWSFGLDLLQPILNANASRYQVDAARARTEQALQQYQQTVQQAFKEVSDALNNYAQFRAVRVAQEEQVRALARSSRLAQLRYASGYSSYLEVLDANRELFAAELALSQAQRDALVSVVQLYRALGGGWMESETSSAVSEG